MGIELDPSDLRIARELAIRQGTSLAGAVAAALRRDMERQGLETSPAIDSEERATRIAAWREAVREVQEAVRRTPVLDPRPYREILYDEDGLPI